MLLDREPRMTTTTEQPYATGLTRANIEREVTLPPG